MGSKEVPLPLADDAEEALARFGAEMYGLALTITGNVPDAEDAYQTAWANALNNWSQLRDPSKRRSWLASIAAHTATHVLRLRAATLRWQVPLSDELRLSALMAWDPGLAGAINRLSARQRAVVALHYGYGFSLDEVASVLGTRGGTVRSHLSRALAKLRVSLGGE
ncbi:MAG TPA: sigma-70 family RNA polymerase sigma factor [Candidatus Saccharimonadales bacterium]|nr:sigma-70 family RNA polymerase sigma factor [Candidatus Saccharimonadales bacterium]